MKRLSFFVVLLYTVFSCSPDSQRNLLVIDTQQTPPAKHNLSAVFQYTASLGLQSSDDFSVNEVRHVVKTPAHIYLAGSNKVLQYDSKGRILRQIGSIGEDSGQYKKLITMTADPGDKHVVLLTSNSLMLYNTDGLLLKSMPLPGRVLPEYAGYPDGQLWVYYKWMGLPGSEGSFYDIGKYYRYNDQLNVTDSSLTATNTNNWQLFSSGHLGTNISVTDSGLFSYSPALVPETVLRDTLYKIEGSAKVPALRLDFSKILKVYDNVEIKQNFQSRQDFFEAMSRVRNITLSNIYRTNRYVFAEYAHGDKVFLFCYDLVNGKAYHMAEGFSDDLFGTHKTVQLLPLDLRKGEFCFVTGGNLTGRNFDWMSTTGDMTMFVVTAK